MQTMLHIKTDKKIRTQLTKIAKDNGLTVTALVNFSLRSLIKNPKIDLILYPEPNARTRKILDEAEEDFKAGRNIVGPFSTKKELDDYFKKLMKKG